MFKIRLFEDKDFEAVKSWWTEQGEMAPVYGMLPLESTFILEIDDVPSLCVTIYLTNSLELAYVENFVGNPRMKSEERKGATKVLNEFLYFFAKSRKVKRLVCLSHKEKLKKYYQELGYRETLTQVSSFVREIE